MAPFFSIIIPMYNRERFIARAIDSCMKQDFEDFEIIVVDDGSQDKSVDVVKRYVDPRIMLIYHEMNRGTGPARNTGVDAAKGEWIICLDSDDELTDNALQTMHKRAHEVRPDIAELRFMCRYAYGRLTPSPPLVDEIIDYYGYIRWMEKTFEGLQETLVVVRRSTFQSVRYANSRMTEGIYHLNFARLFLARDLPEVVRIYHHDADNQLTKPEPRRSILAAPDQAKGIEDVLTDHAEALSKYAPRVYHSMITGLATQWFLSRKRLKGIQCIAVSICRRPFNVKPWVVLAVGVLGSRPLGWLQTGWDRVKSRGLIIA
jgi:glycosyltransferase involved in cell wall biosynthesis